ncbi:hypothetical protein B0H19DRAFT_1083049 [Mycena capillaripes]|nr:hypothetical protein B0H19DRAFT_1083049 [Mycena capillaripes]
MALFYHKARLCGVFVHALFTPVRGNPACTQSQHKAWLCGYKDEDLRHLMAQVRRMSVQVHEIKTKRTKPRQKRWRAPETVQVRQDDMQFRSAMDELQFSPLFWDGCNETQRRQLAHGVSAPAAHVKSSFAFPTDSGFSCEQLGGCGCQQLSNAAVIPSAVTFDEYKCPNASSFPHHFSQIPQRIEPSTYIARIRRFTQSRKVGV